MAQISSKEQDNYDILSPYIGIHITYASRKKLSSYLPSSLMMDYIVHQINTCLADNYYFKRVVPDYHPYIIRLYYGIIFWIQCLRAAHSVGALDFKDHEFLMRFLHVFPTESLPMAGPLIPLFKTLCSSQPEISTYGMLYPHLPNVAGPTRRDAFIRDDSFALVIPNVPGIFALLEDLNFIINATQPRYPKLGHHTPITAKATQAVVFGHHSFPVAADRTPLQSWSLISSGLQYPCEADSKLNEAFAERYSCFDFPDTMAADNLEDVKDFLSLSKSLSWFFNIKTVATAAASYFKDSGTLADCHPTGVVANQIRVCYATPKTLPITPTCMASYDYDLFPFSFRLCTAASNLPALSEAMAAMAQTNITMFAGHPYLSNIGRTTLVGEFWDIRPEEVSYTDRSSYLAVSNIVNKMMRSRI